MVSQKYFRSLKNLFIFLESNGISNDEDSNHSQQSLDSVGGTKPPHLAQNTVKDEPKEILKKPEVKENGLNGNSNGCIDGITKDTSNEKTTEDNLKTDKMVSFYFFHKVTQNRIYFLDN